jgi:hypothetical protein
VLEAATYAPGMPETTSLTRRIPSPRSVTCRLSAPDLTTMRSEAGSGGKGAAPGAAAALL